MANPLEDVFAGSGGITNVLCDLLGTEAVLETVVSEEYNESNDKPHLEIRRQKVPLVIEGNTSNVKGTSVPNSNMFSSSQNSSSFNLAENVSLVGTIPSANLVTAPVPLKSRMIVGADIYQVESAAPNYVGGAVDSYALTLRKM